MGVITDFFIASSKDISKVLEGWQLPELSLLSSPSLGQFTTPCASVGLVNGLPPSALPLADPRANPAPAIDTLPNVQCNCMLPDKVALLFASLCEISTERALELILLGYLTGPPDSEITVQLLPSAFTRALANAQSADLVQAARVLEDDNFLQWGSYEHRHSQDLGRLLEQIQTLARQGLSTESHLFLWTCT